MVNTAFALGEDDAFFFESPSRRVYNNLPPAILTFLSAGDIAQTVNLTFGPGGSYMLSFAQPHSRGYQVSTAHLPPSLLTWLFAKDTAGDFARSFSTLQVSLGGKTESYWASDGLSFVWKGIPPKLGTKLASLQKKGGAGGWTMTPEIVSLGMGEDYVLLAKGGGEVEISWNLENYPDMEETVRVVLEKKVLNGVKNFALNPFKKDTYVLLVNDVLIQNGTPDETKDAVGKLADDVKADIAAEEKALAAKSQASSQASYDRAQAAIRRSQQQIWDMENNSGGLTRQVCKSCTRPRGLCDCAVANYQTEYLI